MSKVYAIKKGRFIGKVYSWDECLEATRGFSGAEYKSFKTDEEADAYLRGEVVHKAIDSKGTRVEVKTPTSYDVANLFCDGGFKDEMISYGVYIEGAMKEVLDCGCIEPFGFPSQSRNIVGEVLGCLAGLQLCGMLGYKRINIYHDYEGLGRWVSGAFQAKSEIAIRYLNTYNQIVQKYGLACRFFTVSGHSGIRGNEIADKLSTRARKQHIEASSESIWRLNYKPNLQNPMLFL